MPAGGESPSASVTDPHEEAELLSRLRANDSRACEAFVRVQSGPALAVARRLLGNEADAHEAVQDAFMAFFRSLPTFRADARLSTWLHRIVVNSALMKRRSRRSRPECNIDDLLPRYHDDGHRFDPHPGGWAESAESLAQSAEVRRLVREKIDQLPEEYRNVLLLRDIEGMDTAETAAALGDSPGAVKTRLHRARQALRTLLEKDFLKWNVS
jgi:RNA polymerase sigma-70 factor (ECF subfamily)